MTRQGRFEEAEPPLRETLRLDPKQIDAHLALAKGARARNDENGVLDRLRAALALDPGRSTLKQEIAACLRSAGRWSEAVAAYEALVEEFADDGRLRLALGQVRQEAGFVDAARQALQTAVTKSLRDPDLLVQIARAMRRADDPQGAQATLRLALEEKPTHFMALAELGGLATRRGDYEGALKWLREAAALATDPARTNLEIEIAQVLRRMGRRAEALAACEALAAAAPENGRLLLHLGQLQHELGRREAALETLRAAAAAATDTNLMTQISRTLRTERLFGEADALMRRAWEQAPDNFDVLTELALVARGANDDERALQWFHRAAAERPEDPTTAFEVATTLHHLNRTSEADALMRQAEAMPGADAHESFRLRRLRRLCDAFQFDAALTCLKEFDAAKPLPAGAVASGMALYAARGDWADVLRLLRDEASLRTGSASISPSNTMLEAIGRAARALAAQEETVGWLRRWEASSLPSVVNLIEQLVEERAVLALVDVRAALPDVEQTSAMRRNRARRMAAMLEIREPAPKGTVYFCTDRNYLLGTLVAMSSLLRHNRSAVRNCRLYVFCSEDTVAIAAPLLTQLAAAYAVTIETVSAADLGRPHKGFRVDWGAFTPGHRLSDAAYYRILAAIWLAETKNAERAVYLDSDTVVGPGFVDLLRTDLAGQPLGARTEEWRRIVRAARKLGVAPERYFNSGVLLLDLDHKQALAGLVGALEFAVQKPELLSMLDQCALNVAFQHRTTPLPAGFNYYLRPEDPADQIPADVRVYHLLGRPKSWDPAYDTLNNARWLDEFASLADVYSSAQMRLFLASTMSDYVTVATGGAAT